MTFGERIMFLASTIFKWGATSGLTGSRGHRGHWVFHEERPSYTMTIGERIMFLALTVFKWGATSCLTGSRGHRGQAMCHEERPSLTFPFGTRIKFLALTLFKWEATSGLTGSRGHRGQATCHTHLCCLPKVLVKEFWKKLKSFRIYAQNKFKILKIKQIIKNKAMTSSWRHLNFHL